MPRPEQTPTPQFERGDDLAFGEAALLNDGIEGIDETQPLPEDDLLSFLTGEDEEDDFEDEDFEPESDEEEFLFGSTDRPDEPITAGAPFGLGPDLPTAAFEDDSDFRSRLAQMVSGDGGDPILRAWARRVEKGL